MRRIIEPRDDNPKNIFIESDMMISLVCTDCEPERVVSLTDVSHWRTTAGPEQERQGQDYALVHMADWLEHMRAVHGIAPNWKHAH